MFVFLGQSSKIMCSAVSGADEGVERLTLHSIADSLSS